MTEVLACDANTFNADQPFRYGELKRSPLPRLRLSDLEHGLGIALDADLQTVLKLAEWITLERAPNRGASLKPTGPQATARVLRHERGRTGDQHG